ncbi:hypothetical protein DV735_g1837, partial [Chaetothyriales sp. CBS 134920]
MSLLFPRSSAHAAPSRHDLGPFYSLWNDTFSELQRLSDNLPVHHSFAPRFDVKESKDAYTLEGELPGIDQKDVTIEFNDDKTLVIQGRTEYHREDGHPPATRKATVEDVDDTKAQDSKDTKDAKDAKGDGAAAAPAPTGSASAGKEVSQTGAGSTEVANPAQPQVTYWVSERSVGSFQRSFTFPQPVSHDAKASLKNGILTVVIPKIQKPATPRRVQIEGPMYMSAAIMTWNGDDADDCYYPCTSLVPVPEETPPQALTVNGDLPMASYDSEKFGPTFQNLAARFKQHANKTNDRFQEVASQSVHEGGPGREPEESAKHPRQADASNRSDMDAHTTKFTANKLQFLSNYKLRVESAKNEPGLRHLLGHISIYDAVREWRQAEARAGIEMIEASMKKLSHTAKASPSSPLHAQEPDDVDVSDVESESESATESDYDSGSDDMSWPGDEEAISDVEEGDCSIMPDLELVKYVALRSTSMAWREDDDSGQLGLGLAKELKFVKIDMRVH